MDGPNEKYKYVLSIDIGIKNLAMMLLECNENYTISDIVWFELLDITDFCHLDRESKKTCKLFHTKTISDWLSHIFFLHKELFDLCEIILVEKQPPQGHVSVEQLIFFHFREKCVLVYPRSVHKFYNWGPTVDYEARKLKSVDILLYRLKTTKRPWLIEQFEKLSRKHDISDAYIQASYFLFKKNLEYTENLRNTRGCETPCDDTLSWLNKFKHIMPVDFTEEIY